MTDSITLDVEGLTATQVAEIIDRVRAMREQPADAAEDDDDSWADAPSTGWTVEHVDLLRAALFNRGKAAQLAAFDSAIERGGYVSRAVVFDLGGYDEGRKLNNWTAPFKAVVADLVANHGLPVGAVAPIEPNYGPGTGYRPAAGFDVAPEIVRLKRS